MSFILAEAAALTVKLVKRSGAGRAVGEVFGWSKCVGVYRREVLKDLEEECWKEEI